MKERKHLLLEKSLTKLPVGWEEWFQQWETTCDPLTLQSLLHHGPEMIEAKHSAGREKAVIHYLQLATRFYDVRHLFGERTFDIETTIFTCTRHSLAKSAFQTILKWKFKKTSLNEKPWEYFLYAEGNMILELVSFLGLGDLEIHTKEDGLHLLLTAVKERYWETLSEFSIEFAKAIIKPVFIGSQDDKNRKYWLKLWQPYRRHAIKALWYFDQLDFLTEDTDRIDEDLLLEFKKLLMAQKISTNIADTTSRTPESVSDILKSSIGISDREKKLSKAACIYLGLTAV